MIDVNAYTIDVNTYVTAVKIYEIDVKTSRTPQRVPTAQVGRTGVLSSSGNIQGTLKERSAYDHHLVYSSL